MSFTCQKNRFSDRPFHDRIVALSLAPLLGGYSITKSVAMKLRLDTGFPLRKCGNFSLTFDGRFMFQVFFIFTY